MLKTVDFYYFSPTGGTRKAGGLLASGLAETVREIDLAEKNIPTPSSDLVVVAAPVFAGRIPAIVSEKLAGLHGAGRKAVTVAVYGVRAYDDALLELNDGMKNSGFEVVASAALIAQHSIVPEVGAGRPDGADAAEIRSFAQQILNAVREGKTGAVSVPGNHPYRDPMKVPATPISLDACTSCGQCAAVCPTDAISITAQGVTTDIAKCIMCMACTAHCPVRARVLPPSLQAGMTQKLGALKDVRRENKLVL